MNLGEEALYPPSAAFDTTNIRYYSASVTSGYLLPQGGSLRFNGPKDSTRILAFR